MPITIPIVNFKCTMRTVLPTILYDWISKVATVNRKSLNFEMGPLWTNTPWNIRYCNVLMIRVDDAAETKNFFFLFSLCIRSVKNELRYVDRVLYNFKTIAYDVENNSGSVTTIVEIEDLPSEDPIWVIPFATLRFDEKTTQVTGILRWTIAFIVANARPSFASPTPGKCVSIR